MILYDFGREESFDLMTIKMDGWPASLTKPEKNSLKTKKRGNHLRPQSTAEKNLNSAAVLLITRTLQVQFVVLPVVIF